VVGSGTYTKMSNMSKQKCECLSAHACVCVRVCVCTCACVCVRSCMRVCVHVLSHLQEEQHGVCVVSAGGDVQQAVHQQDAHEVTHLLPGGMGPLFLLCPNWGEVKSLTAMLRNGTHSLDLKALHVTMTPSVPNRYCSPNSKY